MEELKMVSERSEYKGSPMIKLMRDETDRYPFQFGVRKAQLILENIDDIKQFVEEEGEE